MSVQSLAHFIVRMTVDYTMLRNYLDPDFQLLPAGNDARTLRRIRRACGDLTETEIELIRSRNWSAMFRYIEENGPRPEPPSPINDEPVGEDQLNYP